MTDLGDRTKYIGGTDASAIAGLNPWSTPMDVWFEKTGRMVDVLDSEVMYWGREIEPVIANRYAADTGRTLKECVALHDAAHPWAGGHPDRLIYPDQGVLEIKTAGLHMRQHWGDPPYGEIPQQYFIQVQWYMWLTGFEWADVAVLIGGQDYRVYYVPRNNAVIERLINVCGDFWENNVLKDTAPEIDGGDGTKKYLATLDRNAETVGSTLTAEQFADNYRTAAARVKFWSRELAIAKHNLINELGSNRTMIGRDWQITASTRKDGALYSKFTDKKGDI